MQGAKSLAACLFLDVGSPSSAFAIADVWHSRQASSWHLVTFQALCLASIYNIWLPKNLVVKETSFKQQFGRNCYDLG